jgi:predicted metal-dependent hydrolase
MASKPSYRDLERENKRLNDKMRLIQAASIKAAEHLTGMMAKKELAVLMLESVNEQAANSLITKHQLFQ